MKNLKKMLSEQSDEILPDKRIQNNIKRELGFSEQTNEVAYAHGDTTTKRTNKTVIFSLAAIALALILFFCILLPSLLHANTPGLIDNGKFGQIKSAEDFYAYGAASVGSILSAQNDAEAADTNKIQPLSFVTAAQTSLSSDEQEIADIVNGYLGLAEGLLGDGDITHTKPQSHTDAAYENYAFKTVISYLDLLDETACYTLYFNEMQTSAETDEEKDETKEEYAINGLLLAGGKAYPVRGEREIENEDDETEIALRFIAYRNEQDEAQRIPYLRMEQETEYESDETEQKYVYTYYDENGKQTERTVVEYEQEDDKLTLKMTIEQESGRDELVFKRDSKNKNELDVRAKIEGKSTDFKIIVETGKYRYEFSDGTSYDDERKQGKGSDD